MATSFCHIGVSTTFQQISQVQLNNGLVLDYANYTLGGQIRLPWLELELSLVFFATKPPLNNIAEPVGVFLRPIYTKT